jgi:dihydroorotase
LLSLLEVLAMFRLTFAAFLAALLFAPNAGAQAQYDLLLKGGHVIDPRNGINAVRDVAVRDGRIAAVAENIAPAQARTVLEVNGLYVTPGLLDLHVHVFPTTGITGAWAGDSSVGPDGFSFRTGATTRVDAGSSGWRNFEYFRNTVIDDARTRVLALINIAGFGMINDTIEQEDFNPKEVARLAKKHSDVVVGVKSAHYQRPDWKSVDSAIEAGQAAGIPIMVDFGYFLPERPFWQLVTEKLRSGDMPTHCFRGPVPWVDENGKLYAYLTKARQRGVKFDVGHGGGSFVFRNAVPAIAQGFYPDSISTDLHTGSMNGGMMDMQTLMSKFLAMGMPLDAVVAASTWNPARQIHREELGHLSVGALADVAVFRLMEGRFGYRDASNGKLEGRQRLFCELTLKDGRVMWDWNSLEGTDYKKLGPTYGVRKGVDQVLPPK